MTRLERARPEQPHARRPLRAIMVVFVLLQLLLPAWGLYHAQTEGEVLRFSWHMFSRLPQDDSGSPRTNGE